MKKIRRINLFAGPGAGKSTACAQLFSRMKLAGFNVEQVTEYVKAWAILERKIKIFDQVYLWGKQMNREYICLEGKIDSIITDSPLPLCAIYSKYYREQGKVTPQALMDLSCSFENMYPSLNIFLNRGDKEYHTEGRYQTPEEAYEIEDQEAFNKVEGSGIDNLILEQWPKYTERFKELYGYEMADPTLNVFKYDDYDGMLKLISSVIK